MIAVLDFVDGFGHDTEVIGIFSTLEDAKKYFFHNFKYQEFEFGKVNFDIYDTKICYVNNRKRKKH